MIGLFLLWFVCGIASAAIASAKGNSGCLWAIIGFILGPIGVLIAALMPKSEKVAARDAYVEAGPMQTCQYCRSLIPVNASVCRFCQRTQGS